MLRRTSGSQSDAPLPAGGDVAPERTAAIPVTSGSPASSGVVERPVVMAPARLGGGGTMATLGVLTILFGAWGGIIPFVGPLFGFSADGSASWSWDLPHALLWVVPGAVAVLMGFLMLAQAPAVSAGIVSGGPWLVGFITVLCGAWFVMGPIVWPVLEAAGVPFHSAGPLHTAAYWIGYSLGPGVILAMLGGCSMGVGLLNRRAVAAETASYVSSRATQAAA